MNMNTRLRDWVGRVIQGALVGALGGAICGWVSARRCAPVRCEVSAPRSFMTIFRHNRECETIT